MMNERKDDRSRWGEPEYAPGAPGDREQVFDEEPYLGTEDDRVDGDRMARSDRIPGTEGIGGTPEPGDSSAVGGALVAGGAGAVAGGAVAGPPGAVVGGVIGAVAGAAAAGAAEDEAKVFPEDGGA